MDNKLAVEFAGKIIPQKPINDSFTLAKCYVMSVGKNRKQLDITKEATEDALPTLFNIPVVGHLYQGEDGQWHMGGHDKELIKDENGKYKFKRLTVPFGVVPNQENAHFEEILDKDGVKREYLVADVILWTSRFPELFDAAYNEEILFNESMEVDFLNVEKTADHYLKINKFQFNALCLLGKSDDADYNVNPCFLSASVETYEFSEEQQWERLKQDFKNELAEVFSEFDKQNNEEGGKRMLTSERVAEILKEYGIAQDKLTFDFGSMSEEEFVAKLKEMSQAADGEPKTEPTGEPTGNFAADETYNQLATILRDGACKLCSYTSFEYKDYFVCDFTNEYVYLHYSIQNADGQKSGHIRCAFTVEGDRAIIDVENAVEVKLRWVTTEDETSFAAHEAEFAALENYKKEREEADRRKLYGEKIAEFSDLTELEEYKALVGNAMEFSSVDALEKELFALRGKYGTSVPKNKNKAENVRIPVSFGSNEEDSLAEQERRFVKKYSPNQANK